MMVSGVGISLPSNRQKPAILSVVRYSSLRRKHKHQWRATCYIADALVNSTVEWTNGCLREIDRAQCVPSPPARLRAAYPAVYPISRQPHDGRTETAEALHDVMKSSGHFRTRPTITYRRGETGEKLACVVSLDGGSSRRVARRLAMRSLLHRLSPRRSRANFLESEAELETGSHHRRQWHQRICQRQTLPNDSGCHRRYSAEWWNHHRSRDLRHDVRLAIRKQADFSGLCQSGYNDSKVDGDS